MRIAKIPEQKQDETSWRQTKAPSLLDINDDLAKCFVSVITKCLACERYAKFRKIAHSRKKYPRNTILFCLAKINTREN